MKSLVVCAIVSLLAGCGGAAPAEDSRELQVERGGEPLREQPRIQAGFGGECNPIRECAAGLECVSFPAWSSVPTPHEYTERVCGFTCTDAAATEACASMGGACAYLSANAGPGTTTCLRQP